MEPLIAPEHHAAPPGGTERDDLFVRSGIYGSFLSGGFAGHVYGAEGIWGADIEPEAPVKMWEAFQWSSGSQMRYLRDFAFSIGKRYQELVPIADLVTPNKTHNYRAYEGWAYAARTPDKRVFLGYFEKGCPRSQVRGVQLNSVYRAQWFDPRNGSWRDAGAAEPLRSPRVCRPTNGAFSNSAGCSRPRASAAANGSASSSPARWRAGRRC